MQSFRYTVDRRVSALWLFVRERGQCGDEPGTVYFQVSIDRGSLTEELFDHFKQSSNRTSVKGKSPGQAPSRSARVTLALARRVK